MDSQPQFITIRYPFRWEKLVPSTSSSTQHHHIWISNPLRSANRQQTQQTPTTTNIVYLLHCSIFKSFWQWINLAISHCLNCRFGFHCDNVSDSRIKISADNKCNGNKREGKILAKKTNELYRENIGAMKAKANVIYRSLEP